MSTCWDNIKQFEKQYQTCDQQNDIQSRLNKTKTSQSKFFTQLDKQQQKLINRKNHQSIKIFKKLKYNNKILNLASRQSSQMNELLENFQIKQFCSIALDLFTPQKQKSLKKINFQRLEQLTSQYYSYQTFKKLTSEVQINAKSQKNIEKPIVSRYCEKILFDGSKFKGLCQNGVMVNGQITFQNGFIYEGDLFLDKFHGKGKLTLPQKQVIQADWIEGLTVGKVIIHYPKGQIYYGEIEKFKRHGNGHLFFTDGAKYQGQFINGQLTGYGTYILPKGQKIQGYWYYGDFIGANQKIFQNILTNMTENKIDNSKNGSNKKFGSTIFNFR